MFPTSSSRNSVEPLEQRIAPAGVINEAGFKFAAGGSDFLLHAGEGLTTGVGPSSGSYLLYVEKGSAIVFTTDFNLNGVVDFNEITGISAGDGLRLISFVDIHGDIVTNLKADTTLSDSDNNPANDPQTLRGDGRVLLNSTIEKIELRSVQESDFTVNATTDFDGDGVVDEAYLQQRLALSSYSIFGNVLAGKGFGAADGGLIINTTGFSLQETTFTAGNTSPELYFATKPSIGSIKTGTAASGQYFSFGVSNGDDVQGRLNSFVPANGQVGGDIINVRATTPTATFNIGSLEAGNGGVGGRGGSIIDVQLNGDTAGGYKVIAGNGGRGPTGGAGGSITNFADLGSITSEVVLQTGSGGQGTTGAGGAAGNAIFGTLNFSGGVQVKLGSGGDGFNLGGNGASLGTATVITPEGAVPFGVNMIGLATDPSKSTVTTPLDNIGTTLPVDFNNDGVGDYVYTTNDPGQLVVMFANPNFDPTLDPDPFSFGVDEVGQTIYHRVFLDGPINGEPLVVADFNGDGNQDIVVSSTDDGNFAGVTVFLSKFEDVNADGILTPVEDANQNGFNDFLGFELPMHSALPTLFAGDSENFFGIFGFRRAAVNVADLAAGDFNGDGFTDVAVLGTFYTPNLNVSQKIIFMLADVEDGKPTGQFYADFGTKAAPGVLAAPRYPVYSFGGLPGDVLIESTKLTGASAADVLIASSKNQFNGDGSNLFRVIDFANGVTAPVPSLTPFPFGQVDTNRNLPEGNNQNIALQPVTLRDIIVLDYNGDGFADVVVLADNPEGFMVAFTGDGIGGFTKTTGSGQNAGIFFGNSGNNAANSGLGVGTSILGIRATDADGNGLFNDILAINYSFANIIILDAVRLTGGSVNNQGGLLSYEAVSPSIIPRDTSIVAFDTVITNIATRSTVWPAPSPLLPPSRSFGGIWPTKTAPFQFIEFPDLSLVGVLETPLTANSVNIFAGDGGDALVGKGGTGGFIGGGLGTVTVTDPNGVTTSDAVGAISITLPGNVAYSGVVKLFAGDGGNGFTTGGFGGSVTGITTRFNGPTIHTSVALIGGTGGFGVSGAGGNGGNVSSNSIEGGEYFAGGDGGRGMTGGNGGSVIGNGRREVFDNLDLFVEVHGGDGGAGVKKGGDGGGVTNFSPQFVGLTGSTGGFYVVNGGDAGSAVSGPGGRGGSVVNSAPRPGENKLAGEIFVIGGNGGLGTVGGAGGSVTTFLNQPSGDNPTIVSFLGGNGGGGTVGNGGAGGSVTGVTTPSTGVTQDLAPNGSGYGFNRVIAGDGGVSASATGGAGGVVSSINVTASEGPFAIVGGAGGAGLFSGGAGGSVLSSTVTIGDTALAKILVIAGAGGDGHAFIPNTLDQTPNQVQTAFGGKVGVGGKGGDITGFKQELAISARVDLIAGNGGSTVNYGTVADAKIFVGKGGSITNTKTVGTVGNMDATTPIKAYNDSDFDGRTDQTIAQFVQNTFRLSSADALLLAPTLDDTIGNVGMVVGAAGRLKAIETSPGSFVSQAALFSTNGSLTNLSARGLMSAVAGDVNSIAAIQVASGLKVGFGVAPNFTPGVIGSDKLPTIGVPFDYLDQNGDAEVEPELGYRLVDGALVYRKTTDLGLGPRAFQR